MPSVKPKKPHVRKEGKNWVCRIPNKMGQGVGLGKTPTEAYHRWEFINLIINKDKT